MELDSIRADLERIVGHRSLVEGETMSIVLQRLDQIAASEELDERLQHYLSKRSYVKALAWLDDPDTPHTV